MQALFPFLKNWIGQSTTGQGFALLVTALTGLSTGVLTPLNFAMGAIPAALLILWPQRAGLLPAADALTSDLTRIMAAYKAGRQHNETNGQALLDLLLQPGMLSGVTEDSLTLARVLGRVALPAPGGGATGAAGGVATTLGQDSAGTGSMGLLGPAVRTWLPWTALPVLASLLGLTACGGNTLGQGIAAAEAAYTTANNLEVLAASGQIPGVTLSAADKAAYKDLDNKVYNLLVTVQKEYTSGDPKAIQALVDLNAAIANLQKWMADRGVKHG